MTDDEIVRHDSATTCEVCRKPFTKKNHKVMHHDHITGKYLGPTCNRCNLGLRYPNRKRKANIDHGKMKKIRIAETGKFKYVSADNDEKWAEQE